MPMRLSPWPYIIITGENEFEAKQPTIGYPQNRNNHVGRFFSTSKLPGIYPFRFLWIRQRVTRESRGRYRGQNYRAE